MHRSWAVFAVLAPIIAACATATPSTTPSTARAIPVSADELRRDLQAFAADSMGGRETGTPNELRAARFLATRLAAMGVEPAGDSMYLQRVPMVKATFSAQTRFNVTRDGNAIPLALGGDVVPLVNLGPGAPLPRRNADGELFFAGYGMTTNGRNDFQGAEPGKVIVMLHGAPPGVTDSATRERLEGQDELGQRIGRALQFQPIAVVLLMTGKASDFYSKAAPELLRTVTLAPGDRSTSDAERPLPMVVLGLARAGSPLLPANWPTSDAPQALAGRRFFGRIEVLQTPFTGYNVVGVVRGSDPRWNKTYVAYGSHYDHIGIQSGTSPDSIANGADDDGSGSVAMLGIAKSLMRNRPRRSALMVWHTGEEKGLLGSSYFTDHPTVPRDSIVAQLNADMIGRRGGSNSEFDSRVSGASAANRLYVVGPGAAPNNQSRMLGTLLDSVNAKQTPPFQLDHEWDTPTHPERIYFRSDHYNYAQKGIPVLFFTTGLHEDYHKVSDEAGKIDYVKMARISSLLVDLGIAIGNRETRLKYPGTP
jgi:hypothetical protein